MAIDVTGREPVVPPAARRWSLRRSRYPVAAFLLRRIVAGLATLVVASFLIFLATNALPGDVANTVLGRNATPDRIAALNRALDLDRPLLTRYGSWLGGVVQGDLGQSAVERAQGSADAPVSALIGTPLLNTLILTAIAIVLLIPLSLLLGTIAGTRAGRPLDRGISLVTLLLAVMPEFVLGTLLILLFFTWLDILPPVALVPPGSSPLSHIQDLILPVLTLLGLTAAYATRQIRAGVAEVSRREYVAMARLDGLPRQRVLWRYVVRNALAPSVQSFAQSITYLLGGIIVVETLFGYPGIGSLLVNVVTTRDVTVVQSVSLILAAAYIAINIVADLIVVLLVPRLRTGLR